MTRDESAGERTLPDSAAVTEAGEAWETAEGPKVSRDFGFVLLGVATPTWTSSETFAEDLTKEGKEWHPVVGTKKAEEKAEARQAGVSTLKVLMRRQRCPATSLKSEHVTGTGQVSKPSNEGRRAQISARPDRSGKLDDGYEEDAPQQRQKSATDRERDYAAARARIFGGDDNERSEGDDGCLDVDADDDDSCRVVGESVERVEHQTKERSISNNNNFEAARNIDGVFVNAELRFSSLWAEQALAAAAVSREHPSNGKSVSAHNGVSSCGMPGGILVARGPTENGIGFESRQQRAGVHPAMLLSNGGTDDSKGPRSLWRNRPTDANDRDFSRETYSSGSRGLLTSAGASGAHSFQSSSVGGSGTINGACLAKVNATTKVTNRQSSIQNLGASVVAQAYSNPLRQSVQHQQQPQQSVDSSVPIEHDAQACAYSQQRRTTPQSAKHHTQLHSPQRQGAHHLGGRGNGGPNDNGLTHGPTLKASTSPIPPGMSCPGYHAPHVNYGDAYGYGATTVAGSYESPPVAALYGYGYATNHLQYSPFARGYPDAYGTPVQRPPVARHRPTQHHNQKPNQHQNQQHRQGVGADPFLGSVCTHPRTGPPAVGTSPAPSSGGIAVTYSSPRRTTASSSGMSGPPLNHTRNLCDSHTPTNATISTGHGHAYNAVPMLHDESRCHSNNINHHHHCFHSAPYRLGGAGSTKQPHQQHDSQSATHGGRVLSNYVAPHGRGRASPASDTADVRSGTSTDALGSSTAGWPTDALGSSTAGWSTESLGSSATGSSTDALGSSAAFSTSTASHAAKPLPAQNRTYEEEFPSLGK